MAVIGLDRSDRSGRPVSPGLLETLLSRLSGLIFGVSGKISRESGTLITKKFWYENSLTKWLSTSKNSYFLTLCANLELDRWMTK